MVLVLKNPSANAGNGRDVSLIPGLERSPWQPTLLLPGESHGQRSLAGYSSEGHKGLDRTEVI